MDLRVIDNFLTVVQEGNISKAARALHITQPTLSRQLKDLEEQLGTSLFIRGNREIRLTQEGKIFYKRAQEISTLVNRVQNEIKTKEDYTGDIYIGAGETSALAHIGKVIKSIQVDYPKIHFHIVSGDKEDLIDRLDDGLFDICLIFGDFNREKYEYLELPYYDHWVLISKKNALNYGDTINVDELKELPLLLSRQSLSENKFNQLFPIDADKIVATYNLVNNAVILAQQGIGNLVTLDNLVNIEGTDLISRRILPDVSIDMSMIWKKNNRENKLIQLFLKRLSDQIKEETSQ